MKKIKEIGVYDTIPNGISYRFSESGGYGFYGRGKEVYIKFYSIMIVVWL